MITREESREVSGFLKRKNLPLDLKVEILDHISEQINYKVEIQSKDFSLAFAEIKESWKADFVMKKTFFRRRSRTKIHRETVRKSNTEILKKSTFYFLIYFSISLFFIFYNKTIASKLIYSVHSAMVLIFLFMLLFDFKSVRSISSRNPKRNVSFFQTGSYLFINSTLFIAVYILFVFKDKFDTYYNSVFNLIFHAKFNLESFIFITIFNLLAFGWIYGFLYFLEYKKSLKMLEQKINFKL